MTSAFRYSFVHNTTMWWRDRTKEIPYRYCTSLCKSAIKKINILGDTRLRLRMTGKLNIHNKVVSKHYLRRTTITQRIKIHLYQALTMLLQQLRFQQMRRLLKLNKVNNAYIWYTISILRHYGNSTLKQKAQLMLTNPRDAPRGQSRSPNIVPFHMLGIFQLVQ